MGRGFLLRYLAAASGFVILATFVAPPVSAAGNAHLHLQKTVDPTQVSINPNIAVTLAVDKTTAIPGDTLTYTAVVTNPTATLGMGGNIDAQTDPNSDAVVAYYWDELEVCAAGCGNGEGNPNWKAVATFENAQPGYQPVQPPKLHAGMSFAAQPVTRSGVVYPTSGDMILGTQISAASTATWTYAAHVVLTPAQIAMLADPAQVSAMRNVIHFEVTPRNSSAAQPFTDLELFTNPFTSAANPGAIANVTVAFTLPDGTTINVRATSSLAPGASATATAQFKVPVPGGRVPSETEAAYVMRLHQLDDSALTASAVASGAGFSGTVYAKSSPVTTNEFVPIVTIAKSGPATVDAGTTETNPLALQNIGGAPASALAITDTVPTSPNGSVSGAPASLAPNAAGSATATYPIPVSQAEGSLTDTASVTWKDANGNPYGPLSSSFTTTVHNILFGATLILTPASAGPNILGTSQKLIATLIDRNRNPIANQTVTFKVTGANSATGTATTDAGGAAQFSYTGTNAGNDVAQATVTAGAVVISSNTASISWGKPLQTIAQTAVQGNFFTNPNNSCTFNIAPPAIPVFTQAFPDILFNPDPSVVPHDISPINNFTRPFFDVTTDVNGNYNGQIMAQGNGAQAGTGSLSNFFAVFTGSFIVNKPGDLTFRVLHDDGYIIGVGGGATRVNGDLEGPVPLTTPFNNYPVVGAWDLGSTGSSSSGPVTVHFPAPGTYPFELDYTECAGGPLFLDLLTESFIPQTSGLSIFVGYADALRQGGSAFPFPWNGSPNVTFVGCTNCPFDAGALRFDNNTPAPITFDAITVDLAQVKHFDIWPHGITLAPGQLLILTETVDDNFDTSDFSGSPCNINNGVIPTVNVTIGGVTTTYKDVNQILNTGGFDLACLRNESLPWRSINGVPTTINVPLPPAASLNLMPFNIPNAVQGQSISVTVSALDGAGNPQVNLPVTLQVNGANAQTLDKNTDAAGLATFTYAGNFAGTDTLQAATFVGGLRSVSNQGTVLWTPPGGNTNNPLGASITNLAPADGTIVTKPTTISAAIAPPAGQAITSWKVFYQALDPGTPVTIASGTGAPPSPLTTFDPTVLPNDTYAITVQATASNGAVQNVTTTVVVLGNLKPGRYVTTYQDLSVPVNGFSMEVRRSYDSFDKTQGDFGVGWKVSVLNFRISSNHVLGGGGWTMYDKQCFFGLCTVAYRNSGPRLITVVFPDQHTELFTFTPDGGTNVFWTCTPAFTAVGAQGTTSTMEPLDDTSCSYTGDGNLYGSHGLYDPQRFKLTTRDGRVFVLDRQLGLVSQTDPNGNKLTIDPAGVHSTSGGSITFTRDASGRITKLVGPAGETLTYAYSGAGDLMSVTDPKGVVTTFVYDSNHNLTSTNGPGGQPLLTSTYDTSGRLTSVTDGSGKTVKIATNVAGQQEVFTDPTGEVFVATLSDRGDLLSQAEIADGHTNTYSFTYDSVGRELSATDPLGHTSAWTYDSMGDLLSSTDPQGRKSTMTYGPHGELLTFTDPAGGTTKYQWDSSLNLVSVTDAAGATTAYTYDVAGNRTSQKNALGAVTGYTYDTAGHLLTQTDPLGRVTTRTYDASGRVLSITDPAGNKTVYTYDPAGLLTSSADPAGAVTRYAYDGLGRTTSVTDPLGRVTSYAYDGDGRVLTQTDPLGGKTSYTYDAAGRELTQTDPTGAVISYAYDGHGRKVKVTDPLGKVTGRSYDDAGNLVSETNPAGGVTTYTYGPEGLKSSATDPLGRTTTFKYDGVGRLVTRTDPLGHVTTNAYDAMGRLTSVTDPLGQTAHFSYDAVGERLTEGDPAGGVTTYTFDLAGQLTAIKDPTVRTTSFTYDAAGRVASSTDPAGHTTTCAYDAAGRQTQVVTPLGRTTRSAYDAAGELTSVTDPLGNSTVYAYDAGGRQVSVTSPLGLTTHTTYDKAGRPLTLTDPLGGTVTFTYDAAGERTSITDPAGHTTTFTYAAMGQLASRAFPWGGTQSYVYDAAGQMASATNARGTTATYSYDAAGRLVARSVPGGSFTQAYDAAGRRTSVSDGTGATTFSYDAAGRTTSVAAQAGTVGYSYDAAGRRSGLTLPGGKTVSYAYDSAGLVASATDWTGAVTSFTHDADGQLASMARPGSTATYAYDPAGRISSIVFTNGATAIDTFTYTYDADGNRLSTASKTGIESYAIDGAGRLTSAHYADGSSAAYTYDAAGNRLSSTTGGVTTSYSYDASGRLVSAGATTLTYDGDGNLLTSGADAFAYDWAGRLTSANVGGVANTYTYNADGVRVASSRGPSSTSYVVDLASDLPAVLADGTNSYVRDPGGSLLEWRTSAGTGTTPLEDALGSVRYQTDSSGAVTASASYGVFGDVRSQSGAVAPFGFTGEQSDPTGLVYLRARYYDPAFGRFLSPDSVDQSGRGTTGFSRYVYAQDNPTTFTDPSGHQSVAERYFLALITGVIGALFIYSAWQIFYQELLHSCVFNGHCYAAPAVAAAGDATIARPWTRVPGKPIDKQAIRDLIKAAAAACAAAGTYGAVVGGFAADNPCNLLPVDVFFVGIDLKEISDHDLRGIQMHPDWDVLEKEPHPATTTTRDWYNGQPECSKDARRLVTGKVACHEFPYFVTNEGGPAGVGSFGAYLELLNYYKNRAQGILLSAFYRRCKIPDGDVFYVRGGPVTWGVCKGPW